MRDQQPAQCEPAANDIETMLSSLVGKFCAESASYYVWIPMVSTVRDLGPGRLDGCCTFPFNLSHWPLLIMVPSWIQFSTSLHDYSSTTITVLHMIFLKPMQSTLEIRDNSVSRRHYYYYRSVLQSLQPLSARWQ